MILTKGNELYGILNKQLIAPLARWVPNRVGQTGKYIIVKNVDPRREYLNVKIGNSSTVYRTGEKINYSPNNDSENLYEMLPIKVMDPLNIYDDCTISLKTYANADITDHTLSDDTTYWIYNGSAGINSSPFCPPLVGQSYDLSPIKKVGYTFANYIPSSSYLEFKSRISEDDCGSKIIGSSVYDDNISSIIVYANKTSTKTYGKMELDNSFQPKNITTMIGDFGQDYAFNNLPNLNFVYYPYDITSPMCQYTSSNITNRKRKFIYKKNTARTIVPITGRQTDYQNVAYIDASGNTKHHLFNSVGLVSDPLHNTKWVGDKNSIVTNRKSALLGRYLDDSIYYVLAYTNLDVMGIILYADNSTEDSDTYVCVPSTDSSVRNSIVTYEGVRYIRWDIQIEKTNKQFSMGLINSSGILDNIYSTAIYSSGYSDLTKSEISKVESNLTRWLE